MITTAADLRPSTRWEETAWAWASEESLVDHTRKPRLCVAALLPFADGKPDWEGFERSIAWMIRCGRHYGIEMAFVLNADTGYIFQLDLDLYREVLSRFRSTFPDQRIVAGVTATGPAADGGQFTVDTYLPQLEIAQSFENIEAMIMTSRGLENSDAEIRRDAYFAIAKHLTVPGIVHALEPAFVDFATPFGPWLLHELASHPSFVGGKISTLDEPHFLYWTSMCRDLGLDFAPHSGDDYGIAQAIRMGEALLIGAGVSACPLICAAKDMWLHDSAQGKAHPCGAGGERFDTRVYKLFEALQSLEDTVFRLDARGSAAAYKHSTATVLQLLGHIAESEVHPDCADRRGDDEPERMREALARPLRMAARLGIPEFRVS